MARPTFSGLLGLFLRTAFCRFRNRNLLRLSKMREARAARKGGKKKRTATEHRQQSKVGGILSAGLLGGLILFFLGFQILGSTNQAAAKVRRESEIAAQSIALKDFRLLERHDRIWKSDRVKGRLHFPPALEDWGRRGDLDGQISAYYEEHGLAGFRPAISIQPWRGEVKWMEAPSRGAWFRVGGLMVGCTSLYVLFMGLGLLNKNLGAADSELLWLFDFPVPRSWLFAVKVVESAFDNIGVLLLTFVPAAMIWQAGGSLLAVIGGASGFAILLALNVAALRVLAEVFFLQSIKRRARGALSGLVTVWSVVMMLFLLYGGQSPQLVHALLGLSEHLPGWLWRNPLMLGLGAEPMTLAHPLSLWWLGLGCTLVWSALCVTAAGWLTRGGFAPAGESAVRAITPMLEPEHQSWLSPLVRREILRMRRQPSVLVQMMAAPAIMLLIQYLQSGTFLMKSLAGNLDSLAASIYGLSVYLVLTSGMSALTQEIKCVNFMLSLPVSLAEAFRAGARLAGGVAITLAMVLSVAAMIAWPRYFSGLAFRLPFILLYLWLLAELLRGIQLLGLSILSDTRVALTARSNYLTMILSAGAGQIIYQGELWGLAVMATLIGLLNYSVWQKVRAELPYLTEPVEELPPRLHLMHGMMALFFFFVGQNLVTLLLLKLGIEAGESAAWGYGISGFVVSTVGVVTLARNQVWCWPSTVGPLPRALAVGVLGWIGAALFGWAWLAALRTFGSLPEGMAMERWHLVLLAVLAAPVVEEIIFRGLVYRGLRQSLSPFWATISASLLFTIVHPGMSAPAVFILAAINSVVLERTGRLWICILVHAGYNAAVLALQ